MRRLFSRLSIVALLILCTYSIIGFWGVPVVVRNVLSDQFAQQGLQPSRIQFLRFNPFTLKLTLENLTLGRDGQAWISVPKAEAQLGWDSLTRKQVRIRVISLQQPKIQLIRSSDGQLNLAQLWHVAPQPEPSEPRTPVIFHIEKISLHDAQLNVNDRSITPALKWEYHPINLTIEQLSNEKDLRATIDLLANNAQGGSINAQGELSLDPLQGQLSLAISPISLPQLQGYLQSLPLRIASGKLELKAQLQWSVGGKDELLSVSQAQLKLNQLALQDRDQKPLLNAQQLSADGIDFKLNGQQINIQQLTADQWSAELQRLADGNLSLVQLFANPNKSASETPPSDSKPWHITLDRAQLTNGQITADDFAISPNRRWQLQNIQASAQGYDSVKNSPIQLSLATQLASGGALKTQGQLTLAPLSGEFDITLNDLALKHGQPYWAPYVNAELLDALLSADLALHVQSSAPISFSVTGNSQLKQLHILDSNQRQDLVKWQQLEVNALNYQHDKSLSIEQVNLHQPFVRFTLNADQSTNFSNLMRPTGNEQSASNSKPLPIKVGQIRIYDGQTRFSDLSLRIPFNSNIQSLNGTIGTLDNSQPVVAPIDLQGQVDRHAPVSIKGQLIPFEPLRKFDIATHFKQIELTTLTPYSGKFAGYRIRKGKLDLDLHYKIENGQLNASHRAVIDQLELGERVDSPDAVNLPLKLAVALMKDSQGRIELDLPVSGDLNNPQFSVAPLIWKAVGNMVSRAVTAPFSALAGLIRGGNEKELSQITFTAGSSELSETAQTQLAQLAGLLKERGQLVLEIEGTSASIDKPILAEERLNRALLSALPEHSPDNTIFTDAERKQALPEVYTKYIKKPLPSGKLSDDQLEILHNELLQHWQNSTLLSRRLAQARAAQIKDYLVDHTQLAADRLYLIDVSETTTSTAQVPSQLSLEAR